MWPPLFLPAPWLPAAEPCPLPAQEGPRAGVSEKGLLPGVEIPSWAAGYRVEKD